jgi:hypothetical protein
MIVIVELLIHRVVTPPVTKVVIVDIHMSEVMSGGHGSKDFDKRFTLVWCFIPGRCTFSRDVHEDGQ